MIQEYLLQDPAEKEAIEAYDSNQISKQVFSVDKKDCWRVQFFINGENEDTAKKLSALDEIIRASFHVTVLESGCSAYFNKRLYPLINEFENGLRKLLYISSAINHNEKSSTYNITNLESQDFGQLFTFLFIDMSFVGKAKEEVKNRNREFFSKENLIAAIEAIEENTLWDSLLVKDTVPLLRKRFDDVRLYRNDVMHSHHIAWERYREILALFKEINTELHSALHRIEGVEGESSRKPSFNQMLEGALRTQELLKVIANSMKPSLEQIHRLSELLSSNTAITELQHTINGIYASNPSFADSLQNISQIGQLVSELLQTNPSFFMEQDDDSVDDDEPKS